MENLKSYIVNEQSLMIWGRFGEYGHPQSIVHCNDQKFLVNQSALQIIEQSLEYNGLTLRAAKESAKVILKSTSIYPIEINPLKGWVWFSVYGFRHALNVWFALHAIRDYVPYENGKKTLVELINGELLCMPVAYSAFDRRYGRASKYKTLKEARQGNGQYYTYNLKGIVAEQRMEYEF